MKNHFIKYISALLFSTSLMAVDSGIYIELGAGVGMSDKLNAKASNYSHDGGQFGSLALGYQSTVYRFELENIYKISPLSDEDKGDVVQNTQMLNFYFSGYNHSKMVTTFGFGAGISSYSVEELENENIFTYQAMFSIGYMIGKSLTITPEYSYMRTRKSDDFDRNSDHLISLTARYLF